MATSEKKKIKGGHDSRVAGLGIIFSEARRDPAQKRFIICISCSGPFHIKRDRKRRKKKINV